MEEKTTGRSQSPRDKKLLRLLIVIHILAVTYWIFFGNFDVYSIQIFGIVAELLWLPMILLLFLLPVVDFYLWFKSSFQWKSAFFYLLLVSLVFLLYMILNI